VAVRIELFTVAGNVDFEVVPEAALDAAVAGFDAGADPGDAAGPVRCVGWVSAGDDDEEQASDWCEEVDDELGVGLFRQGRGEASGLKPESVDAGEGDLAAAWTDALRKAVARADGGRFAWRTNFDVSGTTGTADDYPSGRGGA
jgi:hypothetical protein